MTEQYRRWYSYHLSRDMEMMVYGDRGYPLILFPTSMGRFYENKNFGLIDSVLWFIEQGLVKIYCIDSIDSQSFYNKGLHPADRIRTHMAYDRMLNDELAPWAMHETGVGKVAVAGASFGGYHAVNFGLKHPEKVGHIFSMGGALDIKRFMDGYYSNDVFYNNPPDFMPGSNNSALWHMNIILGTAEHDFLKNENIWFSNILNKKGIHNWLDIRPGDHDWPVWKAMFPHYLSTIR